MFFVILFLSFLFSTCFRQKEAEFKAREVPIDEWEVSDKIESTTMSTAHCGIKCLKKFAKDQSCTAIIYDEANSICTLAQLAFFNTGLRVAWASSIHSGATNAWFAIDRNSKTGTYALCNIFRTDFNGDTHPWMAIDLLVPHIIKGVDIVERKDGWAHNTNNIQVRIGNIKPFDASTNGNTSYMFNTECGVFIGPGARNGISVVTCTQPISGRYITLQRISKGDTGVINWSEVLVNYSQKDIKTIKIFKMESENKFHHHSKCPPTVGLAECPESHPYSYKQGGYCCNKNIDYERKDSRHPLLNFDSNYCRDDAGTDHNVTCDLPPCINYKCRRYNCYLVNKDLSGGEIMVIELFN